jgi:hypothetical protein
MGDMAFILWLELLITIMPLLVGLFICAPLLTPPRFYMDVFCGVVSILMPLEGAEILAAL